MENLIYLKVQNCALHQVKILQLWYLILLSYQFFGFSLRYNMVMFANKDAFGNVVSLNIRRGCRRTSLSPCLRCAWSWPCHSGRRRSLDPPALLLGEQQPICQTSQGGTCLKTAARSCTQMRPQQRLA